jgi:hypothetical protein
MMVRTSAARLLVALGAALHGHGERRCLAADCRVPNQAIVKPPQL